MSLREKTNILYYLMRRLQGTIKKPVPRALPYKKARNLRLKHRTPARRKKALERQKNLQELKRLRRRGRRAKRWTGSLKPVRRTPRGRR